MEDDEIAEIIWKFALENSVKFGGSPNEKAVMGKVMAEQKDLRAHSKRVLNLINDICNQVRLMNLEEQTSKLLMVNPEALEKKETIKEEKELPDLPKVDKYQKIIMRLAPYPSGALHIGNARMIVLNNEYVKRYKGELILFYDDTIGSPKMLRDSPKAKYVLPESYDLIKEGLDWLNVKYNKIYYKSDRLEIFYDYCERLLKDGMAYVCFCPAEEFSENFKKKKQACPHRNKKVELNLKEWNKMLNGDYQETEAVVRLKTGMKQKDPALRDQIIMRISKAAHPRVGTRYIVWPMLEFSWAIDDYLIGVTHILRGSDLVKEDFIENFIWEHFRWKKAQFLHYGRIRFPNMKLSKTDARNKIQKGIYDGWDDPRTWSLQSLKKRGIHPDALKKALLDLGMSMSGITFSVNWLYAKNQDIIDEISDRYFYVENPVCLEVKNVKNKTYNAEPLLLPSNPKKGSRSIKISAENEEIKFYISKSDFEGMKKSQVIRLKDLFNIKVDHIDKKSNKVISHFHSEELDRSFSIIQWVPLENYIDVRILKPDGSVSTGVGEINLEDIPLEKTIQFERYGFVNPIKRKNGTLVCYFTH